MNPRMIICSGGSKEQDHGGDTRRLAKASGRCRFSVSRPRHHGYHWTQAGRRSHRKFAIRNFWFFSVAFKRCIRVLPHRLLQPHSCRIELGRELCHFPAWRATDHWDLWIGVMTDLAAQALDDVFRRVRALDVSLSEQLRSFAETTRRERPDFAEAVDRLIDRLREYGAGEAAPKPGEPMPGFVLPD